MTRRGCRLWPMSRQHAHRPLPRPQPAGARAAPPAGPPARSKPATCPAIARDTSGRTPAPSARGRSMSERRRDDPDPVADGEQNLDTVAKHLGARMGRVRTVGWRVMSRSGDVTVPVRQGGCEAADRQRAAHPRCRAASRGDGRARFRRFGRLTGHGSRLARDAHPKVVQDSDRWPGLWCHPRPDGSDERSRLEKANQATAGTLSPRVRCDRARAAEPAGVGSGSGPGPRGPRLAGRAGGGHLGEGRPVAVRCRGVRRDRGLRAGRCGRARTRRRSGRCRDRCARDPRADARLREGVHGVRRRRARRRPDAGGRDERGHAVLGVGDADGLPVDGPQPECRCVLLLPTRRADCECAHRDEGPRPWGSGPFVWMPPGVSAPRISTSGPMSVYARALGADTRRPNASGGRRLRSRDRPVADGVAMVAIGGDAADRLELPGGT